MNNKNLGLWVKMNFEIAKFLSNNFIFFIEILVVKLFL